MGSEAECRLGVNERIDPGVPRAASTARTCSSSAAVPPDRTTANTASTITMPIIRTNWKKSVQSTPHRPDNEAIAAVRNMIPRVIARASTLPTPSVSRRILTTARLTQP